MIAAERGQFADGVLLAERALAQFAEEDDVRAEGLLRTTLAWMLLDAPQRNPDQALQLLTDAHTRLAQAGMQIELPTPKPSSPAPTPCSATPTRPSPGPDLPGTPRRHGPSRNSPGPTRPRPRPATQRRDQRRHRRNATGRRWRTYSRAGLHPPVSFRLATKDGGWLHAEAITNNQLADPDIAGVVVNVHDVTARATSLHALMRALSRVTEYRDPYTAGHQLQVAAIAREIGKRLGLPEADCELIALGGAIHDIGKIAIPAEILTKPGKLTYAEQAMMRSHTQVGHDILDGIAFAKPVLDIVLHHHERLDGSGYPHHLKGESIMLDTRIVAVADVADAMAAHRPYRPALGLAAACAHLRENSDSLYDPDVVKT